MVDQKSQNDVDEKARKAYEEKMNAFFRNVGAAPEQNNPDLGSQFDKQANPAGTLHSNETFLNFSAKMAKKNPNYALNGLLPPDTKIKVEGVLTKKVHIEGLSGPIKVRKSEVAGALSGDPIEAARKANAMAALALANGVHKNGPIEIGASDNIKTILLFMAAQQHNLAVSNKADILALRGTPDWDAAQAAWNESLNPAATKAAPASTLKPRTEQTIENMSMVAGDAAIALGVISPQQRARAENVHFELAAISLQMTKKKGNTSEAKQAVSDHMKSLTDQFRGKSAEEIETLVHKHFYNEQKLRAKHFEEGKDAVESNAVLPIGVPQFGFILGDMKLLDPEAKELLMAVQADVRTLETIRKERAGEALKTPVGKDGRHLDEDKLFPDFDKMKFQPPALTKEAQTNYKNTFTTIKAHAMNGANMDDDMKRSYKATLVQNQTNAMLNLDNTAKQIMSSGMRNHGQIASDIQSVIEHYRNGGSPAQTVKPSAASPGPGPV